MKKYEVCAKCGHVGRNNYIEKTFAVEAINGREAAAKVRFFPRVKHDQKDAIRYVRLIDDSRFEEIYTNCLNDPYFHCHNIQEQRRICNLESEIKREQEDIDYKKTNNEEIQPKQKKKIKRLSKSELIRTYFDEVNSLLEDEKKNRPATSRRRSVLLITWNMFI